MRRGGEGQGRGGGGGGGEVRGGGGGAEQGEGEGEMRGADGGVVVGWDVVWCVVWIGGAVADEGGDGLEAVVGLEGVGVAVVVAREEGVRDGLVVVGERGAGGRAGG